MKNVTMWDISRGPSSKTIQTLRECTAIGAPVILMSPVLGVVYDARLTSVSDQKLMLDVPLEEIEALIEGSWCVISFSHQGSAKAIFAITKECLKRPSPRLSRLVLQISSDVFGVQPRSAYRIPVQKEAELRVRVTLPDGRALMANPVNLSLTGILIEFVGKDPNLDIGTQVRFELMLKENIALLSGEVKRRNKQQYAFAFPNVVYERGLLPPESLRTIVHALDSS